MSIMHKDVQAKLTKSLLDLIILQLLDSHPMHGYEIITTIRKSFGVYFGASTIYPLLNTMEKKKYIKCEWNMNSERPRKVYQLTNEGRAILDYTNGSLKAICKIIGTDNIETRNGNQHVQFNIAQSPKRKEYYPY